MGKPFRWLVTPFFLCGLLACVSPPPGPAHSDAAILGIKVHVRQPLLRFVKTAGQVVYFVRIDAGDVFSQESVVLSNYADGGYVYLVNAEPGRYAAVAVGYPFSSSSGPVGVGGGVSVSVGVSGLVITFFDAGLIEKTLVTVEPSSAAFMGEVEVDRSFTMSDADEVQEHYLEVLAPGVSSAQAFLGPYCKGTERSWNGGETATRAFVDRSRSAFQSAGWTVALENVASSPPGD